MTDPRSPSSPKSHAATSDESCPSQHHAHQASPDPLDTDPPPKGIAVLRRTGRRRRRITPDHVASPIPASTAAAEAHGGGESTADGTVNGLHPQQGVGVPSLGTLDSQSREPGQGTAHPQHSRKHKGTGHTEAPAQSATAPGANMTDLQSAPPLSQEEDPKVRAKVGMNESADIAPARRRRKKIAGKPGPSAFPQLPHERTLQLQSPSIHTHTHQPSSSSTSPTRSSADQASDTAQRAAPRTDKLADAMQQRLWRLQMDELREGDQRAEGQQHLSQHGGYMQRGNQERLPRRRTTRSMLRGADVQTGQHLIPLIFKCVQPTVYG